MFLYGMFIVILIHLTQLGCLGINLLPCTDVVTQADLLAARNIVEDGTPPGYILDDLTPEVTTGRNPHRWIGTFRRNDNQYNVGCQYLTMVKREFKRVCPQGSEIRVVRLQNGPNRQCIIVEFLVNCFCSNIPNRRRRRGIKCNPFQYKTEHDNCNPLK